MITRLRHLSAFLTLAAATAMTLAAAPALATTLSPALAPSARSHAVRYWFANKSYRASESVGRYPLLIKRSDARQPGVICWGVTIASPQDGHMFGKVSHVPVEFAAGQSQRTVSFKVIDQGIRGPSRRARAYMYPCGGRTKVSTGHEFITLLQNDPLQARDPANVLGYQTPTDGDPLQHVDWYVFGKRSGAGKAAARYSHSNPQWSKDLRVLADTPGSLSYRFWMWNQPTSRLPKVVEQYLAEAERRQPDTTIPLTTYDLVHGHCLNPSSIEGRYQRWISALARGVGNFKVVLYLEEDALITTHCLTKSQLAVRMKDELAYAVKAFAKDPHVLVYIDAGAPDAAITPARDAKMLRMADVRQAAGFFVNSTHHMWSTTDIRYAQAISKLAGGAHFIVNSGGNGRGPLRNPDPADGGPEQLCNPPGRGLGPLSWHTGYKGLDGLLWFNNPGNSVGPCGHGDPRTAVFFPAFAVGLVQRRVNRVSGPHFHLIKSKNDM